MGAFGSHIADLSFQLIGLAAFFVCLIIFSIGLKMSSRNGIRNLLPKLILTPFCILCFAVFFAVMPQPGWWEFNSLGGVNGSFILAKITIPHYITFILAGIFAVILISIIIEISVADWIYFFRYSFVTTRFLFEKLMKFVKNEEVLQLREPEPQPVKKVKPVIINDEEEVVDEEEDKELLKQKLKTGKTKKPVRSKKSTYQLPTADLLTWCKSWACSNAS